MLQVAKLAKKSWQSPVARGISFISAMRYSTKAFSLLRLIIVARLLGSQAPAQLGMFGIALLIIAITEVFTQTGINIILIKSSDKLKKYLDTAWGISIVRGFIISGLIWLLVPGIVNFYRAPGLQVYLHWAAIIPILRGFINPGIISYQQNLQFGRESLLRTSLQLIDGLAGLIFAWILGNALGLIWGAILGVLTEVILSFYLFKPWPSLTRFKFSLIWPLFKETKFVIVNGMVVYLNENLDDILVGRFLGTAGLGYYQTAYKLASAATIEVGSTVRDTLYPIYAKIIDKQNSFKKLESQVQWRQIIFYAIILGPGLLLAKPFIELAFGQSWLIITPVLQILLISGALRGLMVAWFPVFILADQVKQNFYNNSLSTIIMILGIVWLAPRYGLVGAAWAILISVILVLPLLWLAKKRSIKIISEKSGLFSSSQTTIIHRINKNIKSPTPASN